MIDTSMTVPKKKNYLPAIKMARGPDLFRGSPDTDAFVYTAYPSKEGKRYFSRPGHIGHESFITEPEVVEAIFGPELDGPSWDAERLRQELESENPSAIHHKRKEYEEKKNNTLRDDLMFDKTVWKHDDQGRLVQPLEAESIKKEYSWEKVRMYGKTRALFGRKGKATIDSGSQDVIMLWPWTGKPNGWMPLLVDMLKELNVSPDAVVTMGVSDQFSAGDFLSADSKKKEELANSVADNNKKNRRFVTLLQQYHTATGADKDALKQLLGFDKDRGDGYPDVSAMTPDEIEKYPWKGHHWQTKMQRMKMLAPGQKWWSMYGDHTDIGFAQYLTFTEMGLI